MNKKPTYEDLESRIHDLESKLEKIEANKSKLEKFDYSKNEEALYMHEQEFKALAENAPDIIFRFDKALKHTYVNAVVEKATGIPKEAFLGKDHRELGMPEDIVLFFQKHIRKVFETKKQIEFSFTFPTPTGEDHFESRYVPEFAKDGTVEYVMGVTRNVTEQKEAEKALITSEIQLKDLNATKDKFFSIIAHDLKSPFSSIIGFSDLLLKNHKKYDSEKLGKYLGHVNNSAKSTYKLLENLLDWSRSQTGKLEFAPKDIKLSTLFDNIETQTDSIAKHKNVFVNFDTSKDLDLFADEYMVNTILRNLISNAIKFTKRNGEIIIKANNTPESINISVCDSGIGISKENQEVLFDLNEKTLTVGTENEKGTGLGLILCKEFVEKHNGQIWLESEVNIGSSFTFSIPHK